MQKTKTETLKMKEKLLRHYKELLAEMKCHVTT